jgi:hypothetical protein
MGLILTDTKRMPEHRIERLGGDTVLACPNCESRRVEAKRAKEVWKGGARQQDRWCLRCGYAWVTVLNPRHMAQQIPLPPIAALRSRR